MSLRLNGSVLGKRNVPTATLATGAWSLRAQSLYRRDNIWPRRDPDAVAFAATSGATDIDAISDFVKGVKRLGLYNSMVCWPLRSTQNAGTGTTAYSLGGLGTFNGTLVNGPTWGTDGIDHTAASSQTTTTSINLVDYGPAGFALFAAIKPKTGTQAFSMMFGQEGGATQNFNGIIRLGSTATTSVQINANFTGGNSQASISTNIVNSWASLGAAVSNSALRLMVNATHNTATPSGTYNSQRENANDTLRFASRSSTGGSQVFADAICAFGALFNMPLSQAQLDSLRTLYKSTLGTGLSLP
jgi:hypothetical protein